MSVIVKTTRCTSLELYRIIVMLFIIAHHYVVNSGLKEIVEASPTTYNSIFFSLFGAWGKTGINCFVLITGYFMCQSEISLRKFLKLFLWIMTYRIVITAIFYMCDYCPYGPTKMWLSIIPFAIVRLNFEDCFLLFYLCIPFLNILIKGLTQKQHILLIGLLLFIYVLHGSIPKLSVIMNYVSWFSVLYVISSYLRLYPIYKRDDVRFWRAMTMLSLTFSICSVLLMSYVSSKTMNHMNIEMIYFLIHDSNSILALTNGICSFMWFKNMKIKEYKLVNTISSCTFGVFLIHTCGNTMRRWLWNDVVDCVGHYNTNYYYIYAIGCVVLIFVACAIIDYIRRITIEKPILDLSENICNKMYARLLNK